MENTDPNNPQTPITPSVPATPATPSEPSTPATSETPATPSVPPVSPAPPVDVEGITKDIRETVTGEVSKSILEKISGALGLNKEEKKALPTDPDELAEFVRNESKKGVQEVLTQQEKDAQAVETEKERQITEGAGRFQSLWTNQYTELAESGRVPKITNADDKNDPGNVAKVKILSKLKEILDINQAKGIDYVPTLKEVFYENLDILNTSTAGENAPISGGGRTISNGSNSLPYNELNKTSTDELVARKYNN